MVFFWKLLVAISHLPRVCDFGGINLDSGEKKLVKMVPTGPMIEATNL